MRARVGKIARLPLAIREELNLRLLQENPPARKLCEWLNGLEEVRLVLMQMPDPNVPGKTVGPIDERNISDWRQGGFADWLNRRHALAATKELATHAASIAASGKWSISEGSAAIAAGKLLEVMEKAVEEGADLETMKELVGMVSELRSGDQAKNKGDLEALKLKQKEEALRQGREKIELLKHKACVAILSEAVRRKAEEIANSNLSNAEKIAAMRKAAFSDVDELEASGGVVLPES